MKRVFLFGVYLCFTLSVIAQIRGNEIRVLVSPDRLDWKYNVNEECLFSIQVLKAQNPLPNVIVDYELE